jgi:hypothetical protein
MPKIGDVVLYHAFGKTLNALVVGSRVSEVAHLGKNGEPLLHLAFIKQIPPNAPHKRPTVLMAELTTPEIEIQYDVVHVSHEFSDAYKSAKGLYSEAQIVSLRGHGEWEEVPVQVAAPAPELPPSDETETIQ